VTDGKKGLEAGAAGTAIGRFLGSIVSEGKVSEVECTPKPRAPLVRECKTALLCTLFRWDWENHTLDQFTTGGEDCVMQPRVIHFRNALCR